MGILCGGIWGMVTKMIGRDMQPTKIEGCATD